MIFRMRSTEVGKVVFWCMGPGTGKKRDRHVDDSDDDCPSKKKSASEIRVARVNDFKVNLRTKHGSTYSGVQYAMRAEMLVGGGHESMDEPPPAPMFGSSRARGKLGSSMTDAFTVLAGSIANALSPPKRKETNHDSPTKSVTLRGKYIEQLRDLVHLKEICALTEEEYQEQRLTVVNLLRKLA